MNISIRMRTKTACFILSAFCLLLPSSVFADEGNAIESGNYDTQTLTTNKPSDMFRVYDFDALPGDTVIVRLGRASGDPYPDFEMYNPDGVTTADYVQVSANEYHLSVTNDGWHNFECSIPASTSNMTFNCSMLRFPNVPLSYADTDVDTIHSGEAKEGTINVSSDLDAGFFAVTNSCTVQIRMGQKDVDLVPNASLYDPDGILVTNDRPPEYRSEITASLTKPGIYTIVCADKFNNAGRYALSLAQIPGDIYSSDPDIGPIIAGETLTGAINEPGDLDIATFPAVAGDIVSLTMEEVDVELNPVIELYNPAGVQMGVGTDVFEKKSIITNTITTNGTFYVICKDAQDRYEQTYTLTFELLGGPSTSNTPATPTGISATDGTYSDHIVITWNTAEGANGYDLWRSYSTNAAIQILTNSSSTSYEDYSVETNVQYFYKVKARNTYGTSEFSDSDSGYCGTLTMSGVRRALLVGIDHYSPSYGPSDLEACTNDAYSMRRTFLLGDPSNRWESENIELLTDVQATKSKIQEELRSLASTCEAGDMVVYYHSSHGGQSSDSDPYATYICTYDADFRDSELAGDLAQFPNETKVIVIIDTCFSGGMFKDPSILQNWPFAERVMEHYKKIKSAQLKKAGKPLPKDFGNNIAFMTACDYDEYSLEIGSHGLYTGYLLEGCILSDVDTDNDGEYEFMELHAYAKEEAEAIAEEYSVSQHAQSYNTNLLSTTAARAVGTGVVITATMMGNDYDGDGVSDLAIYNETQGKWYIYSLRKGVIAWDVTFGGPGYKAVTGDYDGDSKADLALYHEATGHWYIYSLANGVITWDTAWGGPGLNPVMGDYSGDRSCDLALCDNINSYWYVTTLTGNIMVMGSSFTGTGFSPVPGDYNGDRISDYAMYHDETGYWYIISALGSVITWGSSWGGAGYTPVMGDYDGDSVCDLAVYTEELGLWFVWSQAEDANIASGTKYGGPGYTAVPGDYDGDGRADFAVYHRETGYWFIQTAGGTQTILPGLQFGGADYTPVQPTW